MSTSNPYHHGDLRAALLDAAGAILEAEGLDALSLRATARRAGVSHNAPYRHFANRDALLAALAAQGFAELREALTGDTGLEIGVAYVRFALDNPQRFRLMFGGAVSIHSHPELGQFATRTFDDLQRSVAGRGPPERTARIAAAKWSLVHGLAQLLLDGHLQRAAGDDPVAFARAVIGQVQLNTATRRG